MDQGTGRLGNRNAVERKDSAIGARAKGRDRRGSAAKAKQVWIQPVKFKIFNKLHQGPSRKAGLVDQNSMVGPSRRGLPFQKAIATAHPSKRTECPSCFDGPGQPRSNGMMMLMLF
jgi:hypothetical protein